MTEGPLEFAVETPRPADGARFDMYPNPQDLNSGTFVPNPLTGRYVVARSEFADLDSITVLRVWYTRVPAE